MSGERRHISRRFPRPNDTTAGHREPALCGPSSACSRSLQASRRARRCCCGCGFAQGSAWVERCRTRSPSSRSIFAWCRSCCWSLGGLHLLRRTNSQRSPHPAAPSRCPPLMIPIAGTRYPCPFVPSSGRVGPKAISRLRIEAHGQVKHAPGMFQDRPGDNPT